MSIASGVIPQRLRNLTTYLYVLPALLLVVGILYMGIGYTGWASLLNWNGISPPEFAGTDNYARLVRDGTFWRTIQHMVVFGILTIGIQMALGLLLALFLSSPAVRWGGVYRVLVFLPVVLAPAVISTAFRQIFAANGQFNSLLEAIGLGALANPWLADPKFALYALIVIHIWEWTGFSFILYQAAISQIDDSELEAAQIDGAGSWRIIRSVVVPQLIGTHLTLILLGTIGVLKTFDIVYLTTAGGPAGSTEFLTTYIIKQAIGQFNAGYSAALSVVLLLLALAFTLVQVRVQRDRDRG
jgi:raffinose/stachyose/melibiose transport system permease protein